MAKDKEIIDILQLINSDNVGPVTFQKLVEAYGAPALALENIHRHKKIRLFPRKAAEAEAAKAKALGISLVTYGDDDYPDMLRNIADAPPLLYALGDTKLLNYPATLSVVGARNASVNGRKTASRMAFELTNSDVLIISGMAAGIDSAAHKGAMYAKGQKGPTTAVLGTGIDVVYPAQNQELYNQIARQGVIISEFPLGTQPQSNNFPRRNRIVAALGLGTLVVEATLHSGSLITARLALEQGKDIFAIPGSPNEARSMGPNKLIKNGAVLVDDADDILGHLALNNQKTINRLSRCKAMPETSFVAPIKAPQIDSSQISILDYLNHDGVYVDEVIRESGLSAAEVAAKLLDLELEGRIEYMSGNKVALTK